MARRRLETAIQAGKAIEQGQEIGSEFKNMELIHTHRFEDIRDGCYSLQYSYDGSLLAVGYGDGGVEVLDSTTGKMQKTVRKSRMGGLAVTCIRFNPKEQHICLATTSEGDVHSCSTIDGTSTEVITELHNEINCLDFNMDGYYFATAGKDLNIRVYDAASHRLSQIYEGYSYVSPDQSSAGHAQRIFALRYHPENSEVFVTGGWDNHLKIWDIRTKDGVQRTIHGPHVCGDSLDIKGNQILTGSWVAKDSLQIWDFGSGNLVKNIPLPTEVESEFLYCAQFCDNDVVLAGGSGMQGVMAVNQTTDQVVGEALLGRPVQALDSTNGGRLFAFGGVAPRVKLHRMN